MSDAIPSRAAAALAPGFPLALASGEKILLRPFTPQRLLLLHSVECPLFYPEGGFGLPLAWAASMRIMTEPDGEMLAYALAMDGKTGFVADAFRWFGTFKPALAFDDLAAFAAAMKGEWRRLCDLDRADKPGGGGAAGEACAPGTASSPSSSATPSTPGAGASGAPSTAPSASSCSAAAPNAANPNPATSADSAGPS